MKTFINTWEKEPASVKWMCHDHLQCLSWNLFLQVSSIGCKTSHFDVAKSMCLCLCMQFLFVFCTGDSGEWHSQCCLLHMNISSLKTTSIVISTSLKLCHNQISPVSNATCLIIKQNISHNTCSQKDHITPHFCCCHKSFYFCWWCLTGMVY